jgi:polyisoprenoid-binding protein YceI
MRTGLGATLLFATLSLAAPASVGAAEEYTLDGMHTAVTFRISHLGLSWTYGRFNDVGGGFSIDPEAGNCTFAMKINADSIDTGNKKRDDHLRSPDFFNVKQYPTISFQSTAVKAVEGGYEVTGDLTLHGTTRPVSFVLKGGTKAEMPRGVHRTGYSTELTLKRSEFGMDKMLQAIGDPVHIAISFEGIRK